MKQLERLHRFLYLYRRAVSYAFYGIVTVIAFLFAVYLRFELTWPSELTSIAIRALPILVGVRLLMHSLFRLSTGQWRFIGTHDAARLVGSTLAGTVAVFVLTISAGLVPDLPRSVIVIEFVLNVGITASIWISYRLVYEAIRHRSGGQNGRKRVVIIGAGEAGNLLAREMLRSPTGYVPVGFVDDRPAKWGTTLHGVEVIGATDDLPAITRHVKADEIVIAIPSAEPSVMRNIVEICESCELPFRVLPGIREVLDGHVHLGQLREVRIEDLLGREPVILELPELFEALSGSVVLITGAAGSIGSELARQVALHSPSLLILFDQAETPLFYLGRELADRLPDDVLVCRIGDVVNAGTVARVFRQYRPDFVFHAAAYKHVPLMEENPREALRNNLLGTWRIGEAAGQFGARRFVLVSTDKAVRPTSVMGAAKRLAELATLELQDRHPNTFYTAVRFGNVLDSVGSVLPIFRQQMKAGRPLTVTHPDVTRFFMTIPEAVQLILQASLIPSLRGSIAMLDMGEPVKILDLATNLLRLAGVTDDPQNRIVFTGLRPGEKMHEALISPTEESVPTTVAKVRRVLTERDVPIVNFGTFVERVEQLIDRHSDETVARILTDMFSELQLGTSTRPSNQPGSPIAVAN